MASSKDDQKNPGARRATTGGLDKQDRPDMDAAEGELDSLVEFLGATRPDTAATLAQQKERRQTLHQYLSRTLNMSQGEKKTDDDKEANDENLLDRHNRTVAQILTRFRNVIGAATEPLPREGAVFEHAALNRFTMRTEMAALITEIQNLVALNREIKALWMRGPLRKPGENDGLDAEIDRKSAAVADMYQRVMDMFEEKKKAEARAGAGASSSAPGAEIKGEEGVRKESECESQ
ncbi:hypothetical protein DL766_009847 [Monosporascus sp. MC13-8B]|uniref:SNARE-complex protein Syntaxin-18 N-terminal domain-containing protein n=1 Tax=Monosporascus cannonballus TaxID=155416 RepID=A0ABY0H0T8_9PEZI|nr:hypothetical protein DL762_006859 [Monosporascus cannonballus]RYP00833.1 hypothetical protein DL763_000558 [Monosporascus cannonballus]RYP13501.1 hypothetical protein DL766_009847 [Monosporascus sp. MC13-8B]